jgi:Fe-S cluster assembly protein SufD
MTSLATRDPRWLDRLREDAKGSFAALGWPTRKLEEWRYTDLEPISETLFEPAGEVGTSAALTTAIAAQDPAADLAVFVNGRFSASHSRLGALPPGTYLGSFAAWAAEHPDAAHALLQPTRDRARALVDLNAGVFSDGLALIVPAGAALTRPLRCLWWSEAGSAAAVHTRSHISLGADARATVLEIWAGSGSYWNNAVTAVRLDAGSALSLATLQNEATTAHHTATIGVTIAARARFDGFQLMLGGATVRREYRASLTGPQADFTLNGSTLLAGRQDAATVTMVDHTAAGYAPAGKHGTTSNQIFKVALAERAHGVFQGRISVQPGAQKTDAGMLNKTVLLSDRAVIDTKPELEIYADDVKCSHGASVGDLDDTAMFYLRSRGIEPETARRMLIEAFVTEPLDLVAEESIATTLRAALSGRLAGLKG